MSVWSFWKFTWFLRDQTSSRTNAKVVVLEQVSRLDKTTKGGFKTSFTMSEQSWMECWSDLIPQHVENQIALVAGQWKKR